MLGGMSDLAEFLRARRERITPAEVGLPDSGRRRTPGLRREEVATLSGVSVDYLVRLEHGRPITFGKDATRGVRRGANGSLEFCAGDDSDVLTHDAHADDPSLAFALSRLAQPDLRATPIGVFRDVERPVYDDLMTDQLDRAVAKQGPGDLAALLAGGDTWTIS